MKTIKICLAMTAMMLVTGCQSPQAGPVQTKIITLATTQQLLNQAKIVLTDMYFVIEKLDAEAGYLKTKPLSGGQFFEFWRKDNVTFGDVMESSLNSIQRTVEITVDQTDSDARQISCTVYKQRLSFQKPDSDYFTELPSRYSDSSESFQSLRIQDDAKASWMDIGNDKKLAAKIIAEIQKRFK